MKSGTFRPSFAAAITVVGLSFAATSALAQGNEASRVEIHGGTATFDADTNVAVISIHGKSTALEGHARIRQSADGLVIEQLEAALPVRTLNTGMGLRDEHMRKYVFTTPDGLLPDMRFVAERAVCAGSGAAKSCQLSGDMIIRDTPRPFAITLKVSDQGSSFRVTGDGIVKLSTYGIPLPTQLGVTTVDDVKFHVDFVVQRVEARIALSTR
jgi:polyisoprenoid-binding protein YceI